MLRIAPSIMMMRWEAVAITCFSICPLMWRSIYCSHSRIELSSYKKVKYTYMSCYFFYFEPYIYLVLFLHACWSLANIYNREWKYGCGKNSSLAIVHGCAVSSVRFPMCLCSVQDRWEVQWLDKVNRKLQENQDKRNIYCEIIKTIIER